MNSRLKGYCVIKDMAKIKLCQIVGKYEVIIKVKREFIDKYEIYSE
ncbi:hypothetical protein GCM10008905_13380 [Clostridium malenominatum]|uniref:Uncharacterized protein n=1 Tax=Clostridium malenominatum TaxID=1539 RepID=A0ABN1IW02_9CLOT